MKKLATAVLAAAALTLSACGSSHEPCMTLQNGNTVCGRNAAAWCRLTDPSRNAAMQGLGLDQARPLLSTEGDCADIENQYPEQ